MLLERLPEGHVIAVDGSGSMVEEARRRLDPKRTTFVHSDLLELELDAEVDAVFSNAVFHWIHDHEALFAVLGRALRPGGRLEAQCGGNGNIANVLAAVDAVAGADPYRPYLADFDPHHFAEPGETEEILTALGFESVSCGMLEWPVHTPEPREFIRSVCVGAHSELLPEELRAPFVDELMDRLGPDPELDYVRLNISARKRATPA
jgi:trans-aconitate 2-methyltransferase